MGYTTRAILTFVLFTIVMWLYGLGVTATVGPATDWVIERLGAGTTLVLVYAFMMVIGLPGIIAGHRAAKARRSDLSF